MEYATCLVDDHRAEMELEPATSPLSGYGVRKSYQNLGARHCRVKLFMKLIMGSIEPGDALHSMLHARALFFDPSTATRSAFAEKTRQV